MIPTFVRLLAKDDSRQWKQASGLLEADTIVVPATVLLETEWVLRSAFGYDRAVVSLLFAGLLGLPNVEFVEEERVPSDATTTGATWLKVNKDGSPDRRFANNRQVPICQYGTMTMTTQTGLNEEYMFSSVAKLSDFARAMASYIKALAAN